MLVFYSPNLPLVSQFSICPDVIQPATIIFTLMATCEIMALEDTSRSV